MAEASGESLLIAQLEQRAARLDLHRHRSAEAVAHAARAVDRERIAIVPGAPSSHLGRAYLTLGEARAAAGDRDGARAALAAAVDQLRGSVGDAHSDTRAAERWLAQVSAAATP